MARINYGKPIFIGRGVIDSSNQQITIDPDGAPAAETKSLTTGSYYLYDPTAGSSLVAQVQAALRSHSDPNMANATCTFAATTGKVTLGSSGGTGYVITWTQITLRDLLGFTGATTTVAGGGSTTATNQAAWVWRPNAYAQASNDWLTNEGLPESTAIVTRSAGGQVRGTANNDDLRTKLTRFKAIVERRVWEDSTYPNESYQEFWEDIVSQFYRVRYYPDETNVDGIDDYWTYVATQKTAAGVDAKFLEAAAGIASLSIEWYKYVA